MGLPGEEAGLPGVLWRKQNQFKSRGFRGKKEVGTTDREISVPESRF